MKLKDLTAKINQFARDRDWEQFHNPKDLAIVPAYAWKLRPGRLGIEVSELQEWRTA